MGLVYSADIRWESLHNFHRIDDNKTKLAMELFPDVRVLAVYANLAYTDCRGKLDLPDGWFLFTTARNYSLSNGFFGCVLWNPLQQQVVLAHTGTYEVLGNNLN